MSLDTTVAGVLAAVFGAMVALAAGYPPEARLVPLAVGIPAAVLAGWQLLGELARARLGMNEAMHRAEEGSSSREWIAVCWLVLFSLMVLAGGFVIGGTIAVMTSQRFWLRESWPTTVISGITALAITVLCFERALGLVLYGGWLVGWIRG